MKAEFWLNKWKLNEINFHQEAVNDSLRTCWASVGASAGGAVLVPLCGKSLDMCWLAEQGHTVVGIEVSPLACEAFFEEMKLTPRIEKTAAFVHMRAGPFHLLQGDFFAATPADTGLITAVYDRAALVAMPPDLQAAYAGGLLSLLPDSAVGLFNCVEYPPDAMQGPPFSINEARLRELFLPRCEVESLASKNLDTAGTELERRGLVGLAETVYRVSLRP